MVRWNLLAIKPLGCYFYISLSGKASNCKTRSWRCSKDVWPSHNASRGRSVNLCEMNKDKERTLYFFYGGGRWSKTRECICMWLDWAGRNRTSNSRNLGLTSHDLPFFHHCPFRISCYSSKINKFILLLLNFKVLHYPSSSPKKKKNKLQHLMLSVK